MTLWYRVRCAFWLWWEMLVWPSPAWCWTYSQCFDIGVSDSPREDALTEMSYMEP